MSAVSAVAARVEARIPEAHVARCELTDARSRPVDAAGTETVYIRPTT